MKKTLSIIIAAAMTAMAFTTSVSAFTDTSDLNNTQMTILNNAVENGIIKGYEDDTVRPYNTLTRAEFAAMLCRAFGYTTGNGCSFSDAAAHWASAYIQACVDKGAINGIGNNLFDPEAPVTFYQASKIVTIVSGMTDNHDIDSMGGYPLAYITIGQSGSLYSNTTAGFTGEDYNLCRIDAVTMIANTGMPIVEVNPTATVTRGNVISQAHVDEIVDYTFNSSKLRDAYYASEVISSEHLKEILSDSFKLYITGENTLSEAYSYIWEQVNAAEQDFGKSSAQNTLLTGNLKRAITYFHYNRYPKTVSITNDINDVSDLEPLVFDDIIAASTVEGFINSATYDISDTAPIKTDILNTFISIITGEKGRKEAEQAMQGKFVSSAEASGLSASIGMDNYFLAEKKIETALTYFQNAGYHIGVTIVE